MDGSAVSWSSKKQPIITLSTTEAEYIAATHVMREALWIQMFIVEIARFPFDSNPIQNKSPARRTLYLVVLVMQSFEATC